MNAVLPHKTKLGVPLKSASEAAPNTKMEQARALLRPLNLHWAGVALVALINLYLLVQIGLLWRASGKHNADAISQQTIALRTEEAAALPLRGLDAKLARSTDEADRFSRERLPASDSEVAAELGALTKKQAVRLTRAQYMHAPVLVGSAAELTEVRIEATLTGDYRPLVEFINSVERDKMFFVIRSQTLTGQQSGTVNLRVRLVTYERAIARDDTAQGSPLASTQAAGSTTSATTNGGAR